MWGSPQDVFLSFEFHVDRFPNFGATGSPYGNNMHPQIGPKRNYIFTQNTQNLFNTLVAKWLNS